MLKIVTGEKNEILRTKSKPIGKIDSGIKKLAKKMIASLKKENGLGLAAPQIGENIRIVIVRINHGGLTEMIIPMVNPEIIDRSKEEVLGEEGCLSLPGIYGKVNRSKEVRVRFQSLKGDSQILTLQNLNARVVQHEIDHLDGILFVDKAIQEEKELVF